MKYNDRAYFRGWNEKENKFYFFWGIFNNRPYIERSSFPQYDSMPDYLDFEIDDYIGMEDKKGVKIFEEDFIIHDGEDLIFEVVYTPTRGFYPFHKNQLYSDRVTTIDWYPVCHPRLTEETKEKWVADTWEVVGNIHETKREAEK
jgi:hypothetical protein